MDISFADIARLSSTLAPNQTLVVDDKGRLGAHDVTLAPPKDAKLLTEDDFFKALADVTSQAFADGLRSKLEDGTPLSARTIQQVVEKSKTEIETESHLKQLAKGLEAKRDLAVPPDSLQLALGKLSHDAQLVGALVSDACKQELKAVEEARARVASAKTALAEVKGEQLTSGDKVALELLDALVGAESDLAQHLHAFTDQVRRGALDGYSEESALVLETLDDDGIEMELNAQRLENLAASVKLLEDMDKDWATAEFDRLLGSKAVSAEDFKTGQEAIEAFKKEARPFLHALATLDNADPDANTHEMLAMIGAAYAKAQAGLEALKTSPGLDASAVKTLEESLVALKNRADECANSLQLRVERSLLNDLGHSVKAAIGQSFEMISGDYIDSFRNELLAAFSGLKIPFSKICNELKRLNKDGDEAYEAALKDPQSEVNQQLDKISALVAKEETLTLVGLKDFPGKLQRLREICAQEPYKDPLNSLDVRLLGEVIRGEISLGNYISLKEQNIPEEMFRADLEGGKAIMTKHCGSGTFNSVDYYDIPSVRTGAKESYVVKNVEISQDIGASKGVAAVFSDPSHGRNAAKLNYASWKGADLIGCGNAITRPGVVRIKGRYQLAQEIAPGVEYRDVVHNDLPGKLSRFSPPLRSRLKRELHLGCAKLEWADWLSGQLDRTTKNAMVKMEYSSKPDPQTGRVHVQVSFMGIDNDASFPENRTGIYTFKDKDGVTLMDPQQFDQAHVEHIVDRKGVRGMRKPIFLPLSVQKAIKALKVDDYVKAMTPFLSPKALAAAQARFEELKGEAENWPAERVIDDTKTTDTMTDEEVVAQVKDLEKTYKTAFKQVSRNIKFDNTDVAGGFYGYMMQLG